MNSTNATVAAVHDRLLTVAALFGANGGDLRSAAAAAAAAFYAAGGGQSAPTAGGCGSNGLTSTSLNAGYHLLSDGDRLPITGKNFDSEQLEKLHQI